MKQNIYLLKNGSPSGPFSVEEFQSLYRQGLITDSDVVWHEGLNVWISVAKYFGSEKSVMDKARTFLGALLPLSLFQSPRDLSFFRSIPGLISCAVGLFAVIAFLQIGTEVWTHSGARAQKADRDARLAREASLAIRQDLARYQAREYDRIHQENVDEQIRRSRQEWNDYQIFHMTPEQRADAVNRQTLQRMNGR